MPQKSLVRNKFVIRIMKKALNSGFLSFLDKGCSFKEFEETLVNVIENGVYKSKTMYKLYLLNTVYRLFFRITTYRLLLCGCYQKATLNHPPEKPHYTQPHRAQLSW